MQLVKITNNRSSTLLTICYQYVRIILLKNSNNKEQLRVLIKIVFNYIKDYLKEKDAYVFIFNITFAIVFECVAIANEHNKNKFKIPNVLNKLCLLLCSYITMFALSFVN